LMYVAEATTVGKPQLIATSASFNPEVDPTAHRTALAQLESHLFAEGWRRESKPQETLIGVRFYRWRDAGPG
jgi:hypothetical protein